MAIIGGALVFFRHPFTMVIGGVLLFCAFGSVMGRKKNSTKYLQWTRSYRCNDCSKVFEVKNRVK